MSVSSRILLQRGISLGTLQNSAYDSQKFAMRRHFSSTARFQKMNESIDEPRTFLGMPLCFRLLTGRRSERLWWIEEASAPEGLIRECARLPFLENRQSCRRHSAIFGIENHHHSSRAGWRLSKLGIFFLEQRFCVFQLCLRTCVRRGPVCPLHGYNLHGLSVKRCPSPGKGRDFFVLNLKLLSAGRS